MKKFKELELPENNQITLRVPVNSEHFMQIEVLVNGQSYGKFSIDRFATGDFSLGSIDYTTKKKKRVLRWKFPLELTSIDIKTGIVNAHFERKK